MMRTIIAIVAGVIAAIAVISLFATATAGAPRIVANTGFSAFTISVIPVAFLTIGALGLFGAKPPIALSAVVAPIVGFLGLHSFFYLAYAYPPDMTLDGEEFVLLAALAVGGASFAVLRRGGTHA